MSARSKMVMRAAIERMPTGSADQWGSKGPPRFQFVAQVPCYAWSKAKRDIQGDGKEAVIEDLRAMVPLGADVAENDRISSITNRLGAEVFAGPMAVEKIMRRNAHGARGSHLELMLTRHK